MDVERLIADWRGPLVGLLAGWGAPWRDAVELAQDALVETYLGRERLRGDAHDPAVLGPWIRGIARNLFREWSKKNERRREEVLEDVHEVASADPEDERLESLRRALALLPEKFRTVLYLHYLEESGVREVAALLGVSESSVEGRLYQARKALRSALPNATSPPIGKESI